MSKVNIAAKHALFDTAWDPKLVGRVNGTEVKLVKLRGEFVWHSHETEDELFLVTQGRLKMQFRDRTEVVEAGEFIIVPHGVEHCPLADEGEVQVMLFEPSGVVNTGETNDSRRRDVLEEI